MAPSDLVVGNAAEFPDDTFEALNAADTNIADAGNSVEAQQLWRLWMEGVREMRTTNTYQFLIDRALQEDLMYGPRDYPRLYHSGFRRRGPNEDGVDPAEIRWYTVERADATAAPGAGGGGTKKKEWASAAALLAELKKPRRSGLNFFPERVPKGLRRREGLLKSLPQELEDGRKFYGGAFRLKRAKLGAIDEAYKQDERDVPFEGKRKRTRKRTALSVVVEEGETNQAAVERVPIDLLTRLKYARKADGSIVMTNGQPKLVARDRPVRKVTRTLRVVWIPIRLNRKHWEWCYSHWLQNEEMFEPAFMTPYAHNAEFGSGQDRITNQQYTDAAVPLLTRGSMNFQGVEISRFEPGLAKLALPTWEACTLANVQQLPIVDFTDAYTNLFQTALIARELRNAVVMGPEGKITAFYATPPAAGARPARPTPNWATIFRIGNDEESYRYYQNHYVMPTAETADRIGTNGYRDVPEDTPAGAALRKRLGPDAFRGRPIFRHHGATRGGSVADAERDGRASNTATDAEAGQLLDMRIMAYEYVDPEGTYKTSAKSGNNRYYSELWREGMFKPMPIRQISTLPPATLPDGQIRNFREAVDRAGKNENTQVPGYLNFHHGPAGRGGVQQRPADVTPALDRGEDYSYVPQSRADTPPDWHHGRAADSRNWVAPKPAPWYGRELGQRYPETVMCQRGDMDTRANLTTGFLSGASRRRQSWRDLDDFAWFRNSAPEAPTGLKQWRVAGERLEPAARRQLLNDWKRNLDRTELTKMLAPTTLRDALRRYVAENRQAMLYFRRANPNDPESTRVPLLTTPASIDSPAGVYYSCRFDTSPIKGCSGLDSYFPMSKDADVYSIADVALVRGVHDYLREPDDEDPRAGPPEWWLDEEELLSAEQPFDAPTLAKLDAAVPWPPNPGKKAKAVANSKAKAKLRFANGATRDGKPDTYSFGTLVFDTFRSPHVDAAAAARAMPHQDDMAMKRLPIYPKRLTPDSERAVWRRWLQNEERFSDGGRTEISDPDLFGDAVRLWPTERGFLAPPTEPDDAAFAPGQKVSNQVAAEREGDRKRLSTLVAPCYVLALDFDDFRQAVDRGEAAWSAYFAKAENRNYWRDADVYTVFEIESAAGPKYHLGPNPAYVLPGQAVPPRVDGRWDTYDGPPPVWDAEQRRWYVPDALAYSVRPAARMHASWHEDKRAFGGKQMPGDRDRYAELELEKRVRNFEEAFQRYQVERNTWSNLSRLNASLEQRNELLRFHSLRLVWNLSRLQQTQEPRDLFAADEDHVFFVDLLFNDDDEDDEQDTGRREYELWRRSRVGIMRNFAYRLPVVIFLIDTLDHADRVRSEIDILTILSGQLRGRPGGTNTTEILDRVRSAVADTDALPFVKDLVDLDCAWPTVFDIDDMLAPGAAKITAMLQLLSGTTAAAAAQSVDVRSVREVWEHVTAVADALGNNEASQRLPRRSDPMSPYQSVLRILSGMGADGRERRKRYNMVRPDLIKELVVALELNTSADAVQRWKDFCGAQPSDGIPNPVSHVVELVTMAVIELPDRYHPLQAVFLPVMRAVVDAWADMLVQLRVRDHAITRAESLVDDPAEVLQEDIESTHMSILEDAEGEIDNYTGTNRSYPTQLRPAALRTPRQPPAPLEGSDVGAPRSVRDPAADLVAFRDTVGFDPTERTQYEKELLAVTQLMVRMRAADVQSRMFSTAELEVPFDTSQQLLEATANAFSAVFAKLKAVGSPAESLWKLLHNEVVTDENRAELLQAAEDIEARLTRDAPSGEGVDVPFSVLVGAGLVRKLLTDELTERERRVFDARTREARTKQRMRTEQLQNARIRAIHRMAKVLQRTQVLAARAANNVRAQLRELDDTAENAARIAELTAEAEALDEAVKKMRLQVQQALGLVRWMMSAKDQRKLAKLQKLIRQRMKLQRKRNKRARTSGVADAMDERADVGGGAEADVADMEAEGFAPLTAGGPSAEQQASLLAAQRERAARREDDTVLRPLQEAARAPDDDVAASIQLAERVAVQIDPDAARAAGVPLASVQRLVDASMTVVTDPDAGPVNLEQLRAARRIAEATAQQGMAMLEATQEDVDAVNAEFEDPDAPVILPEPSDYGSTSESDDGGGGGTSLAVDGAPLPTGLAAPPGAGDKAETVLDEVLPRTPGAAVVNAQEDWDAVVQLAERGWKGARERELALASRVEWLAERRRRLVDLYVHLLSASPDLEELNGILANVTTDDVPQLTSDMYKDLQTGKTAMPSNSPDIPDIHPWQVWGWEGAYRAYLGDLLRAHSTGGWSLAKVPLTPRQWLMSRFSAGAYPNAPSVGDSDMGARPMPAMTDAERNQAIAVALEEMNLQDDAPLRAHLHRIVDVQREAVESLPPHAPFAFDFDAALDVSTLNASRPASPRDA